MLKPGAARIPDEHDLTLKYVNGFNLALEPFYPPGLSVVRLDRGGTEVVPVEGFTDALSRNLGEDLGGKPERWHRMRAERIFFPRRLPRKLAGKIQYGSVVVRIEQNANEACVFFWNSGRREALTADKVLCTIPFSVLRKVEFAGLAERKRDVIKDTRYDAVSRVYLQTRNRFWEAAGLNGFAFTKNVIEIWQPTWNQPGPRGILMTYARPGEAEKITKLKEAERISTTLKQLDSIFPGLRENFEHGVSKCWMDDEWSRGAWAFAASSDAFNVNTPDERIHFAGEHLSSWVSWMQGALASGLRAVKEIEGVKV